ncbi:heterokaryon incompatibility protein-domain-containing protein [Podospora aff. communis PSN243]|uniref:Heterokaryon incompatibility protein-domain-containing protein n=1 Tax=Podospora aff. communis PSN243 TaxID=3040156 RepID=A0AAV9G505_9PEZI|nr:heterokaryon incompatibility protein-domain-containing protein [Podospora aff. communis PSN243]
MASIYTPLRDARREIRLLNLEPHLDNTFAPIDIRLETANLWQAAEYTCLSYRWGDATDTKSVIVDGHDFPVRTNLHDALKRLRLRDEPRRLWIDAICINQDDNSERAAQVGAMQYIFQNATDVIAWIGEEEGGPHGRPVTQRAADFVRELSFWGRRLLKSNEESNVDDEILDWIRSVTPPGLVGSPWRDFLALIERPWFSRIWIVQEVAVAKAVTVWCGSHRWDWVDFLRCGLLFRKCGFVVMGCAAPRWLRHGEPETWKSMFAEGIGGRLVEAVFKIDSIGRLNARQRFRRQGFESLRWSMKETGIDISCKPGISESWFAAFRHPHTFDDQPSSLSKDNALPRETFYHLVKRFRKFEATDPRDKVYALIGIADSVEYVLDAQHRNLPHISYAREVGVFDVMWDLITTEILHHRSLHFLGDACRIQRPEGFPSWMPLWYDNESHLQSTALPFEGAQLIPEIIYRAGTGLSLAALPMKKTRTLYLGAVCFSQIVELGVVYNRDLTELDEVIWLHKWASMRGITTVEEYDLLTDLKHKNRVSVQEAEKRLRQYSGNGCLGPGGPHRRFFATILASASYKAIDCFCDEDVDKYAKDKWEHYAKARIANVCHGRRMFNSGAGLRAGGGRIPANFGLCPRETRVGDFLVLFAGAKTPHVIRMLGERDENGKHVFGLVGEAYVHNWMRGQMGQGLRGDEELFMFPLR